MSRYYIYNLTYSVTRCYLLHHLSVEFSFVGYQFQYVVMYIFVLLIYFILFLCAFVRVLN